ncbi:hypothetical protein Pmani_031247 [Petrolisthes manimaculis]|uniref:Insertion element IS150 protein InsJ-like helix-turn-helix domain-containing protein n=1 Tax=Petrolisthes manimaculis TaxID=1843537 RepID=A0AAE1NVS0_9EUCA|nr:hypothetical protein Pmani_031247 [Petrolisthes manimaculis]
MREISRLLGISRDTVRLWVRRYQEEGHVFTRLRPGGPRVTTPEEDELIRREVERAPLSNAVSRTNTTGRQCHPITTRRRLQESGPQGNLNYIIFTDEKCFTSVSTASRQCWRVHSAKYVRRNTQ